jgi:hypothetical protein
MTKSGIAEPQRGVTAASPGAAVRTGSSTALDVIGLAWLAVTLAIARGSLHGRAGDVALSTATLSLPALVQAALFAGVSISFAVTLGLATTRSRMLTGVLTGLGVGGLACGVVLVAYGLPTSAATAVAAAVGTAGAIGGTLGALRPARILSAGLTATLPVLILEYAFGHFSEELLKLFGGTGSVAARVSASDHLGLTEAVIQGVVAGVAAFLLLRGSALRFPAFGLAGALPGLLVGVAEIFTRVATPRLLALASEMSVWDQTAYSWGNGNRTNQALVVFFVGALVAIIAHGRTLGRRPTAHDPA